MTIAHIIGFNLKYNVTNANVDLMEREYFEKFSKNMSTCIIYDIIKDKGREIYYVMIKQIVWVEILILNLGIMILLEFMM